MNGLIQWLLAPYQSAALELKKKSEIFLFIIFASLVLFTTILVLELALAQPLIIILPLVLAIILTLASGLLIRSGRYTLSATILTTFVFLIQNVLIVLDKYDNPFDVYRYTLVITTSLMVTGILATRVWPIALMTLAGEIGIFSFWWLRHGTQYGNAFDPVVLASLVSSSVIFLFLGLINAVIHRITKSLLRAAEEDRRQVVQERDTSIKRLDILALYTKPSLVQLILQGQDPSKAVPEERDVVVLFCDIRSFTSISEDLEPMEVIEFLNPYFTTMTSIIVQHNGEVDKLMGDGIMALFSDCNDAVRAATDMRLAIRDYPCSQGIILNNGIGIHYGKVIVGNIGSIYKMDHTVIGEIVNLASRLEALTKDCGYGIVVSSEVHKRLRDPRGFIPLKQVQLRGSSVILDVYAWEEEAYLEATC